MFSQKKNPNFFFGNNFIHENLITSNLNSALRKYPNLRVKLLYLSKDVLEGGSWLRVNVIFENQPSNIESIVADISNTMSKDSRLSRLNFKLELGEFDELYGGYYNIISRKIEYDVPKKRKEYQIGVPITEKFIQSTTPEEIKAVKGITQTEGVKTQHPQEIDFSNVKKIPLIAPPKENANFLDYLQAEIGKILIFSFESYTELLNFITRHKSDIKFEDRFNARVKNL